MAAAAAAAAAAAEAAVVLKDAGAEAAKPLMFFFGADPRDHFFSIAKIRVVEKAKQEFNKEALSVPGYVPMPLLPAAWVSKVPDLVSLCQTLRAELQVATVDGEARLMVPKDADVPVTISPDIQVLLEDLRKRYPDAEELREDVSRREVIAAVVKFNSLADMMAKYQVLKTVKTASYDLIVATESKNGFDVEDGLHSIWVHNPSTTQRVDLDSDTFLCGVESCTVKQETAPDFDPMIPCTIRWSFNRPGSKEATATGCEKEVNAEQTLIYTKATSTGVMSLKKAADAMKEANCHPKGTFWGFRTTVDSKKKVTLKPSEVLWVVPKPLSVQDATVNSVAFFLGFRQASEPNRKWELIKPILVMHPEDQQAQFKPKAFSNMVRFVTAKKLGLGMGQCIRLQ